MTLRQLARLALGALSVALAGCGGGATEGGGGGGGTPTHTVGGTVSGLVGSGLALRNNGGDLLAVAANGIFTFGTALAEGAGYAVTVDAQPSGPAQLCSVSNAAGTVGASDVTSVAVVCSAPASHHVEVQVGNLQGTGLVVQLGAEEVAFLPGGLMAAVFATPLPYGAPYAVAVKTQPTFPAQVCLPVDGSGWMGDADVTVAVACADPTAFAVAGTVSGLVGSGLVLRNTRAAGDDLAAIAADGPFSFPALLAPSETYAVDVLVQPTSPPQVCTVTNGSGSIGGADVLGVTVTCAPPAIYSVGGTVSGLVGTGLVLATAGAPALAVGANGPFTFAAAFPDQAAYDVTISQQPTSPAQTCYVNTVPGVVPGADVTSVVVECTPPLFTVGGTVSGLTGSGLVIGSAAVGTVAVSADGTFTFPGSFLDGWSYVVLVLAQPTAPAQICSVAGGTGVVQGADVTSIAVSCTEAAFTVSGNVSGLTGQGLVLRNNGADPVDVIENGHFTFGEKYFTGTPYAVTVAVQPVKPAQVCTVASGEGTIGNANVTSVVVTCADATYAVGGTVSGLAGTGLSLSINGGDALPVAKDGAFAFPGRLANGSDYSVTVSKQPHEPAQTCKVTDGAGVISGADVTSVVVACVTNEYSVSGTVSGLAGSGLTLTNAGGAPLAISGDGRFAFPATLPDLSAYSVAVQTQPSGPTQVCTVANGAGTVASADVTDVAITCATSTFTVGGTVTGLTGQGLRLTLNAGSTLTIDANGSFTFLAIADGSPYAVTMTAAATGPTQLCSIANGEGTIAGAPVTNVLVDCPRTVQASAVARGSSQIEVRWTPYGVVPSGYEVYEIRPASLPPEQLIATVAGGVTSFVHRGRTPSTLSTYRVAALNTGATVWSAPVTAATPAQVTFPAAPTGLTAERTGGAVTLHWDPYAGATRYDVYRTVFPELVGSAQGRVYVGSTTGATQITDSSEPKIGVHHYQLYAVSTAPARTSPVASLPVTIPAGTPVLGVERPWLDLFRTRGDRTVLHLYWYGAPGATAHHVYASTNSAVITPSEGSVAPPLDGGSTNVPIVEVTPGKYRMDVPLTLFTPGTTVWFRIEAVKGAMRADSEQAAGVNITAPAPAGVGSLQAQVRNPTAVRLTWGMAAGASTYNVYRLPDATTPVAPQYWVGATGALDFTDAGLTPATAYVYRVTAVAVGGAESMPSDYVGVRTLARGAPLLLPASQPGPVLYSAVLGWVPLNEGARYRVYGGESMLVATIDLEALRATVDTFYTLVVIPPEVLAGVLLTYGLVPPVGLYQVAELYPDGTESPRSNAMLVAFF